MKKKNKDIKHIRIRSEKRKSFKKLKNKDFFSFFDNLKHRNSLVEVLILCVRDFNYEDYYTYSDFDELVTEYIDLAEIQYDEIFSMREKERFKKELFKEYELQRFNHFRGEVLEYLMVNIVKNNNNKIYHEPRFYHKRKRILTKQFLGKNCLVDVVDVKRRYNNIRLIECKADLDMVIRRSDGSEGDSFEKKLKYMNELKNELDQYSDEKSYVKTNKIFASLKNPILNLPEGNKEYEVIYLLDYFRVGIIQSM